MIRKIVFAIAVLVLGGVYAVATISSSLNSITVAGTGTSGSPFTVYELRLSKETQK